MKKIHLLFYLFLITTSIVQAQNTNNFITEWNTANNLTEISFKILSTGPVRYSWKTTDSDVVTTGELSASPLYSLMTIPNIPTNKIIELSLEPANLKRFSTTNYTEPINDALVNVKQWGTAVWSDMTTAFYFARNLKITATDIPNLSQVTSTELMFSYCTSLTQVPNINNWDTSNIVNMEGMFRTAVIYNQDLNNWNTSNVTNMYYMFFEAFTFNGNISNWNTSKVTIMESMFYHVYDFNQNIGNWNTGNVTNMQNMFYHAYDFNQNISNWNTGNVTNMQNMFAHAGTFNQNISNWNISNITNMTNMLDSSGMDCTNYSALLNVWGNNPNTPNRVFFTADGLTYGINAEEGRNKLIAKGWNFQGDISSGQECNPSLSATTFSKLEMQYHPNPVTDILNITHQDLIKKVELYTVLGQKIAEEVVNQKQAQINLAKHPKGLYLVKVYTATANGSFKVTKQ